MRAKTTTGWSDPPSRPDQAMMAATLASIARQLRRTQRRWMRLKGNTAPVAGPDGEGCDAPDCYQAWRAYPDG